MKNRRGLTIVEITIVIAVMGILASAFVPGFMPAMNYFFFFPQNSLVGNAAADVLDLIVEGDPGARGLRFAGPSCAIPAGCDGSITAGDDFTLTYSYSNPSECGAAACASSTHSVEIVYDPSDHVFTRAVDGGGAQNIPYYVTTAGTVMLDSFETNSDSEPAVFRYYDSTGTEMSTPVAAPADIYRVDLAVKASTGNGLPLQFSGSAYLKTGVDIKHYTT